jgi:hypothetical protein
MVLRLKQKESISYSSLHDMPKDNASESAVKRFIADELIVKYLIMSPKLQKRFEELSYIS